jgi:uncharacterized protein YndB with AHSA1/START domain
LYYICNQIVVYMDAKPQIKIETFIEAPSSEVWQAITDKTMISQWLMETDIEPLVGFRGYFKMNPMPGFNGRIETTVLQVETNKLFIYTWQGGWMKKPTTVKFSLLEKENGTLLTLEHWGFEGILGNLLRKMMSGGWKKKITVQIARLIHARK